METGNTQTVHRQTNFVSLAEPDAQLTQKRLDWLLDANAETAREKSLFKSDREKVEAWMMSAPLSIENAFAYFGLLLGVFPPTAIFLRFLTDKGVFRREDVWMIGVFAVVNLITATVGFFSGKLLGKTIRQIEAWSWTRMLLVAPFIGVLWGVVTGAAGGVIVFLVGAFVGAFFGGLVGAAALPIFVVLHRALKKGEQFDRRHFLPIAFGIAFAISAFILGS